MKEKVFDKVAEYIDAVAQKLGVAAEHVYGLLVRQQITSGVIDILTGLAVLFVIFAVVKYVLKRIDLEEYDLDEIVLLGFIPVAIILGFGIFGFSFFTDGLKHVINPEYYAIKEIIKAVGGK